MNEQITAKEDQGSTLKQIPEKKSAGAVSAQMAADCLRTAGGLPSSGCSSSAQERSRTSLSTQPSPLKGVLWWSRSRPPANCNQRTR